ncbi:MAG TPA: 2-amino-4-hydroxy-6-hydroxymethyldihydropteridine diphosphokinase [Anaerolineae bacterium]|nr:2-amino-4-hydroxy-6-hydroxymethyldihydropteridine diphosphokinase [Anaerolineae bacterium]
MNASAPLEIPAYLLLGSNIRPEVHLSQALDLLRQRAQVFAVSRVWETPPVGTDGPLFYNAAVGILTSLPPDALKRRLLRPIEAQLGRVRTGDKFAPRPIDIDLVVYASEVLDPEVWQYAHIAIPLSEILPDLRHPQTGEPLARYAARRAQEADCRPVAPPGWPTLSRPPRPSRA